MRVLIVDDDLHRHEGFRRKYRGHTMTFCTTAEQAIQTLLKDDAFDIIQLDHDLTGVFVPSDSDSGAAVARAIAEMAGGKRQGRVIIHSYNREGAMVMLTHFVHRGLPVEYHPYDCFSDV